MIQNKGTLLEAIAILADASVITQDEEERLQDKVELLYEGDERDQ